MEVLPGNPTDVMVSPFMSHTATSPLLVFRQTTLVDAVVGLLFAVWVLGSVWPFSATDVLGAVWLFDAVEVLGTVPPEVLTEELPTFIV
jgi:hypothetical protein